MAVAVREGRASHSRGRLGAESGMRASARPSMRGFPAPRLAGASASSSARWLSGAQVAVTTAVGAPAAACCARTPPARRDSSSGCPKTARRDGRDEERVGVTAGGAFLEVVVGDARLVGSHPCAWPAFACAWKPAGAWSMRSVGSRPSGAARWVRTAVEVKHPGARRARARWLARDGCIANRRGFAVVLAASRGLFCRALLEDDNHGDILSCQALRRRVRVVAARWIARVSRSVGGRVSQVVSGRPRQCWRQLGECSRQGGYNRLHGQGVKGLKQVCEVSIASAVIRPVGSPMRRSPRCIGRLIRPWRSMRMSIGPVGS